MRANERTPTRDELFAMAYVDDELDEEARAAFEARLETEPALAREVVELQRLAVLARTAAPVEPMDHEWSRLERGLVHGGGSRLGWATLLVGGLGLLGWAVLELVRSDMAPVTKGLLLLVFGGLALLLGLAVRARLRTLPYDPYTGIQR